MKRTSSSPSSGYAQPKDFSFIDFLKDKRQRLDETQTCPSLGCSQPKDSIILDRQRLDSVKNVRQRFDKVDKTQICPSLGSSQPKDSILLDRQRLESVKDVRQRFDKVDKTQNCPSLGSSQPKDSILLDRQRLDKVDKTQICSSLGPRDSIILDRQRLESAREKRQQSNKLDKTQISFGAPKLVPVKGSPAVEALCANGALPYSAQARDLQPLGKSVEKESITCNNESILSDSVQRKSGNGNPSFHVVFIIDTSRSMETRDVFQKGKGRINRITAVAEAVEGFSKLLATYPDVLTSVILFNDSAFVDLEAQPISGEGGLMEWLPSLRYLQPRLGGHYLPALQAFRSLHEVRPENITVGVMLSDGRPGDNPGRSHAAVRDMRRDFNDRVVVHSVMFGPEATQNSACLEKVAEAGGGTFHANAELDATALQSTFMRLSAAVSTLRSSVLAFGEKALKRIPEKKLEPEVAWDELPSEELLKRRPVVTREVRGEFMLPTKGGSELDLQRADGEKVAYLHKQPFAQGGMRYASHLWWTSKTGEVYHLVVKESKFEGAHDTPQAVHGFFLKNHRRAQAFAKDFNSTFGIKATGVPTDSLKVKFTPAYVVALRDLEHSAARYLICEKFIPGAYVKYNANDGWVNKALELEESGQIAAAFSHFSFLQSDQKEVCVDVQGVGRRWTDPQIHSRTREFGAGDLGEEGMKMFFRSHTCNQFCRKLNLPEVDVENLSLLTSASCSSTLDKAQKDMACLLCLDSDRTIVNKPCFHLCLCKSCQALQPKKGATCIICRQVVSSIFEAPSLADAMQHSTFYKAPV